MVVHEQDSYCSLKIDNNEKHSFQHPWHELQLVVFPHGLVAKLNTDSSVCTGEYRKLRTAYWAYETAAHIKESRYASLRPAVDSMIAQDPGPFYIEAK